MLQIILYSLFGWLSQLIIFKFGHASRGIFDLVGLRNLTRRSLDASCSADLATKGRNYREVCARELVWGWVEVVWTQTNMTNREDRSRFFLFFFFGRALGTHKLVPLNSAQFSLVGCVQDAGLLSWEVFQMCILIRISVGTMMIFIISIYSYIWYISYKSYVEDAEQPQWTARQLPCFSRLNAWLYQTLKWKISLRAWAFDSTSIKVSFKIGGYFQSENVGVFHSWNENDLGVDTPIHSTPKTKGPPVI